MTDATRATAEGTRLAEADAGTARWRRWGPYLSERGWGTVREDYSADGDAWDSFPHDQARSRTYRWNEDGMAGICDIEQRLCLALAFWNGVDPILKERAFGLTNTQGNHGEDVKEYWWYLDSTPTHSWMRWRYHYPQGAFPYEALLEENARRGRDDPEFELLDTGIFDGHRYWRITADYAKAGPEDMVIRISAHNASPDTATLHVHPLNWPHSTWFCCDPVDERWHTSADRLRMKLAALGIPFLCDLETTGGGHGFEYYGRMAPRAMQFLVERLEQESRRV